MTDKWGFYKVGSGHVRCLDPFEDWLLYGFNRLGIRLYPWASADFLIILNAHVLTRPSFVDGFGGRPCIIYNTEVESTWKAGYRDTLNNAHLVWDYSSYHCVGEETRTHWVPVWNQTRPDAYKKKERNIDLLFYGSVNNRRADLLRTVQRRTDQKFWVAPFGTYGVELSNLLKRARTVLSPRFYPTGPVCSARMIQAWSHGCQVISESAPDWEDYPGALYADWNTLPNACELASSVHLTKDTKHLEERSLEQLKKAIKAA